MRDKAGVIYVACGCFYGTIDEFEAKGKETHGERKHAQVYALAAQMARLQIDTMPMEDEEEGAL